MTGLVDRCAECGGFGNFGLTGLLAAGSRGEVWFCQLHRPADYFTRAALPERSAATATRVGNAGLPLFGSVPSG